MNVKSGKEEREKTEKVKGMGNGGVYVFSIPSASLPVEMGVLYRGEIIQTVFGAHIHKPFCHTGSCEVSCVENQGAQQVAGGIALSFMERDIFME